MSRRTTPPGRQRGVRANAAGRDRRAASQLRAARAELAAAKARLAVLDEENERNLSALCAIADGIAVVDTHGRVTCFNPIAAHLTGWKEDAVLGQPLEDAVRCIDHQGRALDVLADGFSGDPEATVSLVRRDGHVIHIDGAVAPVHARDHRTLGAVVTFRNVTASIRLARELAYQANHDALTGLHNRRAFLSQLQRTLVHARKFGNCTALLYLDLDQFKAVNDGAGHVAGDELLHQLAALLRTQLRERDVVARLGGDEFAVLLENCTPADAAHVAEKMRHAVEGFEFQWDGRSYRVGASIGLVHFDDDSRSVDELIDLADRLCYAAKDGGRNRVAGHGMASPGPLSDARDVSHRPGARWNDVDNAQARRDS